MRALGIADGEDDLDLELPPPLPRPGLDASFGAGQDRGSLQPARAGLVRGASPRRATGEQAEPPPLGDRPCSSADRTARARRAAPLLLGAGRPTGAAATGSSPSGSSACRDATSEAAARRRRRGARRFGVRQRGPRAAGVERAPRLARAGRGPLRRAAAPRAPGGERRRARARPRTWSRPGSTRSSARSSAPAATPRPEMPFILPLGELGRARDDRPLLAGRGAAWSSTTRRTRSGTGGARGAGRSVRGPAQDLRARGRAVARDACEPPTCSSSAPASPVELELDRASLAEARQELEELIAGIRDGRFEVTAEPHAALCWDCPARARLCSHPHRDDRAPARMSLAVFAYGSLVSLASAERTLGRPVEHAGAARLVGLAPALVAGARQPKVEKTFARSRRHRPPALPRPQRRARRSRARPERRPDRGHRGRAGSTRDPRDPLRPDRGHGRGGSRGRPLRPRVHLRRQARELRVPPPAGRGDPRLLRTSRRGGVRRRSGRASSTSSARPPGHTRSRWSRRCWCATGSRPAIRGTGRFAEGLQQRFDVLPPGYPRGPRLWLVPDRRRPRGRRGGRRPSMGHRPLPATQPSARHAHRARARDPQSRRPRLRVTAALPAPPGRRSTSTSSPRAEYPHEPFADGWTLSSARSRSRLSTLRATAPSTPRSCCATPGGEAIPGRC